METAVSFDTSMLVSSYGVGDQGEMWVCRGRCKDVYQRCHSRGSEPTGSGSSDTMIEVETSTTMSLVNGNTHRMNMKVKRSSVVLSTVDQCGLIICVKSLGLDTMTAKGGAMTHEFSNERMPT
jgi:hypothetical protein